jgi:hypothetical protein
MMIENILKHEPIAGGFNKRIKRDKYYTFMATMTDRGQPTPSDAKRTRGPEPPCMTLPMKAGGYLAGGGGGGAIPPLGAKGPAAPLVGAFPPY